MEPFLWTMMALHVIGVMGWINTKPGVQRPAYSTRQVAIATGLRVAFVAWEIALLSHLYAQQS